MLQAKVNLVEAQVAKQELYITSKIGMVYEHKFPKHRLTAESKNYYKEEALHTLANWSADADIATIEVHPFFLAFSVLCSLLSVLCGVNATV